MVAQRRPDRRQLLLQRMPVDGICAEIGVWEGDFSHQIIEVTRPRRLHLIDPWRFEADDAYRDAWYGGKRAQDQAQMDAVYDRVVARFAPLVAAGRVAVHRS